MTNTAKQVINSTLISPAEFSFFDCAKEIHFGFIFSYFAMTCCFLIGIPANLWCLWFFCIKQNVRQSHVFLLNHIIVELILCLECTGEILNMFVFKNTTFTIPLYVFLFISWSGRPLLQTCICIEQYLAVLHPVIFLRYKGIKYRIAAAVAVWFISLVYTLYKFTISLDFPDSFINSLFIITLSVISFCCVSVLLALKHPGPGATYNTDQTGRDAGNQQKRIAFTTIFTSLILILFTYLPQTLLVIFTSHNIDQILLFCNIAPFITSLNVFGVVITPFMKLYKRGHLNCLKYQK